VAAHGRTRGAAARRRAIRTYSDAATWGTLGLIIFSDHSEFVIKRASESATEANNWGEMMRQICYSVAMSLDGYIADARGKSDWIVVDPEIDFPAFMSKFDTVLMGRNTFAAMSAQGGGSLPGMRSVVVSRTLQKKDHADIEILAGPLQEDVTRLRSEPGKDIWLFGGGSLFRSLCGAHQVSTLEVSVIPILLGAGTPLLPPPSEQVRLRLAKSRVYEKTGTVWMKYLIE
jgi:dihydrofolate reductase